MDPPSSALKSLLLTSGLVLVSFSKKSHRYHCCATPTPGLAMTCRCPHGQNQEFLPLLQCPQIRSHQKVSFSSFCSSPCPASEPLSGSLAHLNPALVVILKPLCQNRLGLSFRSPLYPCGILEILLPPGSLSGVPNNFIKGYTGPSVKR